MMEGPRADSEEKQEPASDFDTALEDRLKALDLKPPIREADILTFRKARRRAGISRCFPTGARTGLAVSASKGIVMLRSLFTAGALAVIRYARIHGTGHRPWLTRLLARRPTKVAAIALANKLARMAWAMMARGERYNEPAALAA